MMNTTKTIVATNNEHKNTIDGMEDVDINSEENHNESKHTDDCESNNTSMTTDNESISIDIGTETSKQNKLSLADVVACITTLSTAGSIIVIPWSIGQLGYVLGPILLIFII